MSATATTPARREAMPGLKGKGVLITVGTSGIGQAIAVKFAEYGANVAINYLRTAEDAASELAWCAVVTAKGNASMLLT